MNYKLLKNLPDLNEGSLFTFDEKSGLYLHADYSFKKETVEKNPEWFLRQDELQK